MQHSRSLSQYSDGTLYDSPPASAPISPNGTEWPGSGLKNQGKIFGSQRLLPSAKPAQVWIPAVRKGEEEAKRTLVLCFDGTGDQFDSDNSNVVQLVSMLRKDDTSRQLVYYQAGIGTYTTVHLPVISTASEMLDEMLATNLSMHVKSGYEFLMQNYTVGDKICLFGFSRGAYTARALAGMLQKVGLLPPANHAQVLFAYNMYKREDLEGLELCETFKRTFCRDVDVDFLGVWDTVASVGLIPRYLPFTTENNGVCYLRHALSLDERRVKFLPSFCFGGKKKGVNYHDEQKSAARKFEEALNALDKQECDVLEVWFAGVHADVGGGSVLNDTPHALARIPLRWMIRECFKCNTGIVFDAVMLQQIGLNLSIKDDPRDGLQVELCDPPKRMSPIPVAPEDPIEKPEPITRWTPIISALYTGGSLLRGLFSILALPIVAISSIIGLTHHFRTWHSARGNWLSESARAKIDQKRVKIEKRGKVGTQGRELIPARKRPTLSANASEEDFAALLHHPHELRRDLDENYEANEEMKDALSPLYDQLSAACAWKWQILEWVPQRVKKQKAITRGWEGGFKWMWNRGRGRKIHKDVMAQGPIKVHRSVKTRLEARGIALAHPESSNSDTHVDEDQVYGTEDGSSGRGRSGKRELYVPQVRPWVEITERRRDMSPVRLTHREWNVEEPTLWQWVD